MFPSFQDFSQLCDEDNESVVSFGKIEGFDGKDLKPTTGPEEEDLFHPITPSWKRCLTSKS